MSDDYQSPHQDRIDQLREKSEKMRFADDEMLRSMCQFLALSDGEQRRFLPPVCDGVDYMFNECGDRTPNPLFYYGNAIFELTNRCQGQASEFAMIITDICVLVTIMVEQVNVMPEVWRLNRGMDGISTSNGRIWNVLRRLAGRALEQRGWPASFPEIAFNRTGYSGVLVEQP